MDKFTSIFQYLLIAVILAAIATVGWVVVTAIIIALAPFILLLITGAAVYKIITTLIYWGG